MKQEPEKMYDVINPKTGQLKEYPECMRPITAKSKRLDKDGAEIFHDGLLVNPLHRQPSIKSMVQAAEKSGRLLQMHRAAQNLQLAEDNDPSFQGYNREWLEENFWSEYEFDYLGDDLPPEEAPTAPAEPVEPSNPPAATPPAPPSEGAA